MNNNFKLKLKISNNAYDYLLNLLKFHTEYDCVSLEENISAKCCKSPKVEIGLSNSVNFDIVEKIDDIIFCYNINLCNNIKEVTIIINDSVIHTKVITVDNNLKDNNCGGCGKKKGNCTGCK